jgi:hypothetical protein
VPVLSLEAEIAASPARSTVAPPFVLKGSATLRLQNFGFDAATILPPTRHRTAPRLTPLRRTLSFRRLDEVARMDESEVWLLATLFIILSCFVGFISGFFARASFSQYQRHSARKAREALHSRLAAAEGEPRHDGRVRSMNLPAVVTALVVVSGVIVVDHFRGPLFPDEFYCMNDGGARIMRMCTGRVPP